MKINKLLFFLLALVSLNSCVEYVDNGTKPDGPETPETQNFTAAQSNTATATKVGDTFEFKAELNNVDVTASTKFKVNGADTKGNTYVPFKEGSHAVIATYNNLTANFKFTVEAKDTEPEPEPEPSGNRIEFEGKSYPVDETVWALGVDANNAIAKFPVNGVEFCAWLMQSTKYDNNDEVINQFYSIVLAPINNGNPVLPFGAPTSLVYIAGGVVINGQEVIIEAENVAYTFAATGNTLPSGNVGTTGTGNYTAIATDTGSTKSAELFWNGNYTFYTFKATAKSPKNIKTFNISKEQIKNLKLKK